MRRNSGDVVRRRIRKNGAAKSCLIFSLNQGDAPIPSSGAHDSLGLKASMGLPASEVTLNCVFYFIASEVSGNFTLNATCNGGISGIWKKSVSAQEVNNCAFPAPAPGARRWAKRHRIRLIEKEPALALSKFGCIKINDLALSKYPHRDSHRDKRQANKRNPKSRPEPRADRGKRCAVGRPNGVARDRQGRSLVLDCRSNLAGADPEKPSLRACHMWLCLLGRTLKRRCTKCQRFIFGFLRRLSM
jgi:hypothetical protein